MVRYLFYTIGDLTYQSPLVHTVKSGKASWIGHMLRRNCLVKHVVEGKLEGRIHVTGRQEMRRKQLPCYFKETRNYWKLKEEALDRNVCRTGFGKAMDLS